MTLVRDVQQDTVCMYATPRRNKKENHNAIYDEKKIVFYGEDVMAFK